MILYNELELSLVFITEIWSPHLIFVRSCQQAVCDEGTDGRVPWELQNLHIFHILSSQPLIALPITTASEDVLRCGQFLAHFVVCSMIVMHSYLQTNIPFVAEMCSGRSLFVSYTFSSFNERPLVLSPCYKLAF